MEVDECLAPTIICVKRKLNEDDARNDDRYNSFKKLRHVGSLSQKTDEQGSRQMLRQAGIAQTKVKRIKISDFSEEQFKVYVDKYENKLEGVDQDKSDGLEPNDSSENQITCNGIVLESCQTKGTDYVYDYYILMDNMFWNDDDALDEAINNEKDYDGEPDENDENYRYNDYPDEEDLFNDLDTSDDAHDTEDEDYYHHNPNEDEYGGNESDDSICAQFRDLLRFPADRESGEDSDST